MKLTIELKTVFIATAVALAALAGVAYATIPGGDGVIIGCYKKSGGTLRVVDADVEGCKSNETALPWSQTGPQGAPGEPGEPGAPGISGYEIVTEVEEFTTSTALTGGDMATCPAGKKVLGGGASLVNEDGNFFGGGIDTAEVLQDHPSIDGTGWVATFHVVIVTNPPFDFTTTVYAICAFVDG